MPNLTDSIWRLHRLTNANVVECKSALMEADASFPGAAEILMRRRAGSHERARGKPLNFGVIRILVSEKGASMVYLACNRPTTAKQNLFYDCATQTAKVALVSGPDIRDILATPINGFQNLEAMLDNSIAALGDEQAITAVKVMRGESGTIAGYAHGGDRKGFGRIGALVHLRAPSDPNAQKIARTLAMHLIARAEDMPHLPASQFDRAHPSDIEMLLNDRLAWDDRVGIFDLMNSADHDFHPKDVLRDFACFRVLGPQAY